MGTTREKQFNNRKTTQRFHILYVNQKPGLPNWQVKYIFEIY